MLKYIKHNINLKLIHEILIMQGYNHLSRLGTYLYQHLKEGAFMSVLTTLFVGIDVSKQSNYIRILDFGQNQFLDFKALNNEVGATSIKDKIIPILIQNNFDSVIFIIKSTGVYSYHIATFLCSNDELLKYNSTVYCVNPKVVKKYIESYNDSDKTDPNDALTLADFGRIGRCKNLSPWRSPQLLAL